MAEGEVIEGAARVIDADMLAVGKTRMILWGLDAPERSQECRLNKKTWTCWNVAARELQILVANGPVRCENKGIADVFKRIYAICTANGVNINEAFVRSGMALALREQSEDYVAAETDARQRNAGLWQDGAEFVEPWVWRKTRASNGAR
ncbi:MAG: thermonuclease family protein [Alphaproteobacteria bacterium]|nr:thermonuclease family protein [Alphaproteobacteria bacterium]